MCVQPPRVPSTSTLLAVEHLRRHVPDERDPLRVRDRRRRPDVRIERQVPGVRRLPDVRDRHANRRRGACATLALASSSESTSVANTRRRLKARGARRRWAGRLRLVAPRRSGRPARRRRRVSGDAGCLSHARERDLPRLHADGEEARDGDDAGGREEGLSRLRRRARRAADPRPGPGPARSRRSRCRPH